LKTKFVKYEILSTETNIILDAPHSKPPIADKFTDIIAKEVAKFLNVSYIISNVSREVEADLNRDENYKLPLQKDARREYIKVLSYIKERIKKPLLHVAIHGIKDNYGYDLF